MNKNVLLSAIAVGAASCAASAQSVITFAYNNLAGTYDGTAGIFSAAAVDTPGLQSIGDVTRLSAPAGTADFNSGFVSAPNLADVVFNISVTGIDQINGLAFGSGSFTLTDTDGSTLSGSINGVWIRGGLGQTFFNGDITNASFNGATFDGESGSFSTNLGFLPPYEGAVTVLFLRPGAAGFFDANFSAIATQFQGELIPTPGAVALVGLGGLAALRRRR